MNSSKSLLSSEVFIQEDDEPSLQLKESKLYLKNELILEPMDEVNDEPFYEQM
jgi:hypothetical protein